MNGRALQRALRDFRKHPWIHAISISTITISLVILGAFLLFYRNLEVLAEKTSPQVTGTAYLNEGLSAEDVQVLRDRVLTYPNVENVVFKSKDAVLEELEDFLGSSEPTEFPASSIFPDVLEVVLSPDIEPAGITATKTLIESNFGVLEVDFSEDWLSQYKRVRGVIGFAGLILMLVVVFGSSLITANFMGMRHQAKRNEIDIVTLIGAPRRFILAPFLWEGLIEGGMGGAVALILLYATSFMATALLTAQWSQMIGMEQLLFLSAGQLLLVIALGVVMASIGSLTVFLRFQNRSVR